MFQEGWEKGHGALELHEQGWKPKDIAAALGVTEGAVSQWLKKGKEQGAEALRHQPAPGATPKLTAEQRALASQPEVQSGISPSRKPPNATKLRLRDRMS